MSADVPTPAAGSPIVPGYVVTSLLGRGGSGEVWRAVPRAGGPAVAVKVLVEGDPERQAREAALLGALDHPHLVRLIEVVHQPRRGAPARVALVLDLLEGGSLAALLDRRGRLRAGEVVTAMAPVAAALAHAHGSGIVHGDLSPSNILFTAEGRPVLTDLGVARVLGEETDAEVTPAYVDPTVARGGAPGPASDVFGVAAAAFHALTGIPPWNAATPADVLAVAAVGQLPDLRELAPDAPAELLTVIERGLSAEPHDRGSAAAFALDLRHACRPDPVRLPVAGQPDVGGSRTGRGPRTELTHQVPGRHARRAPVVVDPVGERRASRAWSRARSGARSGVWRRLRGAGAGRVRVLLTAVAVVLIAAGLAGALGGRPAPPSSMTAAGAAPAPTGPTPPAEATVPAGPVAGDAATDWTAVVTQLYQRRAAAFESGAPAMLEEVYVPGSPLLATDRDQVAALAEQGWSLQGFAPEVLRVEPISVTEDRVRVAVIDRWPDYRVIGARAGAGAADGAVVREAPGRPESAARMVLIRVEEGWRIDTAVRIE